MAKCKYCGRGGLFLSLNQYGLCSNCAGAISIEMNSRLRVIQESINLVKESRKLDIRLSRCDLVIKIASEIVEKFESKGITVMDPSATELLRRYKAGRDEIIKDSFEKDYQKALAKVEVSTSPKTKTSTLSKILLKIQDYKHQTSKPDVLIPLENNITQEIHQIQLDSFTDEAKKAEFKGNSKKALDKYYEALYFLKTDKIDDSKQKEFIQSIESKIKNLGGEIPS
jgi:hypothetical protein